MTDLATIAARHSGFHRCDESGGGNDRPYGPCDAAQAAAEAERLWEALGDIAFMGGDCPPAMDPATFYRYQFYNAVGTAARARAAPSQRGRP